MTTLKASLLGFTTFERATFETFFQLTSKRSPAYVAEEDARAADFIIADADDDAVCQELAHMGAMERCLVIGRTVRSAAGAQLARPINLMLVIRALDGLSSRRRPAGAGGPGTAPPTAGLSAAPTHSRPTANAPVLRQAPLAGQQTAGQVMAAIASAAGTTGRGIGSTVSGHAYNVAASAAHTALPGGAQDLDLVLRTGALPASVNPRDLAAASAAAAEVAAAAAKSAPPPVAGAWTNLLKPATPAAPPVAGAAAPSKPVAYTAPHLVQHSPSHQPRVAAPPMDHILVVDDSDVALRFMTLHLARFGFEIHLVRSGKEAIEKVAQRHFEFVFLDVVMEGLDGYQTCRVIKRSSYPNRRPPPTVVMVTSRNTAMDKLRGTMAGCDAYLTKPLEEAALLKVIGAREVANLAYQDTAAGSSNF